MPPTSHVISSLSADDLGGLSGKQALSHIGAEPHGLAGGDR